MSLYENWIRLAYDKEGRSLESLWKKYLPLETEIYKELLATGTKEISGTVKELGARYHMPVEYICGFVDGINGALKEQVDVQEMTEDDLLHLEFEFDDLYKKMVDYKADHLYKLSEWENIFDEETRKNMYQEQKRSRTVVKEHEPGRNEPCPCGSGKKYKKCCGAA